ncbi:hypothetical protein Tco_0968787 [Tanacetum coccineum]
MEGFTVCKAIYPPEYLRIWEGAPEWCYTVSVDPAQALNVPIVPLGAMLTAVYSLTSRPPYSLAWLNHMISTQDIMDPDLLKKLVLKNFCTIPAKLLLQLASAFKERGLSDRSGTFFYQEHIHKINVPILVVASDQDAICPLKLYKKFDTLNIDDDLQTHCISVTFTGYGSYWNGRWRLKYISYLNRIWLLLEWKTEVEVYQLPYIIWLLLEWKTEVEVYQLPYIIWSTLRVRESYLLAVYSLTSRPPYSLAWLNHMISTQDIMDPDLLKKLVLKNFCTIPAKLLLQLASAFKERGLSDRSGTFFYQEHIHKINVPILVVASDQDAICPLKLYKLPSQDMAPIGMEDGETTREEGQHGISAATGISDLEQVLQQKTFTRSEIERLKAFLHSRSNESSSRANLYSSPSSKVALRQDLVLHNNATGFLKSPNTLIAPKIANGFTTPRSRGRPAMYSMARTPYATSPSTFTRKGITSSYGREEALTSSRSAFQHGGKMALKRRSSILDDDIGSGVPLRRTRQKANLALTRRSFVRDGDIGSGGPLRRTRQKANLLTLRDKRELGYTALQQPDHASQKLLLMNESEPKIVKGAEKKRDTSMHGSGSVSGYANVPTKSTQTATKILQHLEKMDLKEKSSGSTKSPTKLTLDMLHGKAFRSLEKVDSPKLLSYPHDNQTSKSKAHGSEIRVQGWKGDDEKAANIFGNLDAPASTALPGQPFFYTTTTTGSGLFGSSSLAVTSTTKNKSLASFFNVSNGSQANTQASVAVTPSVPSLFGSGTTSIPTSTSEGKYGNSTSGPATSIFGSTWDPEKSSRFYNFGVSATPTPSGTTSIPSSTFGTSHFSSSAFTIGTSSSFSISSMTASSDGKYGNSTSGPATSIFGSTWDPTKSFRFGTTYNFGATSPATTMIPQLLYISLCMDGMVEDCMQTPTPVPAFGQTSVALPPFTFDSGTQPPFVQLCPHPDWWPAKTNCYQESVYNKHGFGIATKIFPAFALKDGLRHVPHYGLVLAGVAGLPSSVIGIDCPKYHLKDYRKGNEEEGSEVSYVGLQRMESIRCHFFNANDLDSKRSIWVSWNKVLTSKEKEGVRAFMLYKELMVALIELENVDRENGFEYLLFGRIGEGVQRLKEVFQAFMRSEVNKHISVAFKFEQTSLASSLRRMPPSGIEFEQWDHLLDSLEGLMLSPSEDRWIKEVPIKVNVHAWIGRINGLPTGGTFHVEGFRLRNLHVNGLGMQLEILLWE